MDDRTPPKQYTTHTSNAEGTRYSFLVQDCDVKGYNTMKDKSFAFKTTYAFFFKLVKISIKYILFFFVIKKLTFLSYAD